MAKKIVLAGACRTAIGTMGGELSTVPAADLGAIVIKEALNRAGVAPEKVDQVYMGCVLQAGQGQNVARQAAIHAGIPVEVPATTVNVLCGSGLHCVNLAQGFKEPVIYYQRDKDDYKSVHVFIRF